MGGRGAMRRSLVGVLVGLVLVPVVGSGFALAAAPAAPTYAEATSVQWGLVTDEWGTYCQLTANAVLDRPMGGGERVFAHVWVHATWIEFDGTPVPQEWVFMSGRLGSGTDAFSGTTGFQLPSKYGHYEVDWVRFDLAYRSLPNRPGVVYDTLTRDTAFGC
jgi:hypothetical protein